MIHGYMGGINEKYCGWVVFKVLWEMLFLMHVTCSIFVDAVVTIWIEKRMHKTFFITNERMNKQ